MLGTAIALLFTLYGSIYLESQMIAYAGLELTILYIFLLMGIVHVIAEYNRQPWVWNYSIIFYVLMIGNLTFLLLMTKSLGWFIILCLICGIAILRALSKMEIEALEKEAMIAREPIPEPKEEEKPEVPLETYSVGSNTVPQLVPVPDNQKVIYVKPSEVKEPVHVEPEIIIESKSTKEKNPTVKKKAGRPKGSGKKKIAKKKAGRPKGSVKKTTAKKTSTKKKAGRPKGTAKKKTGKVGRPKGSVKKIAGRPKGTVKQTAKKAGRPKGTAKKTTAKKKTGKVGRPKGSVNKTSKSSSSKKSKAGRPKKNKVGRPAKKEWIRTGNKLIRATVMDKDQIES